MKIESVGEVGVGMVTTSPFLDWRKEGPWLPHTSPKEGGREVYGHGSLSLSLSLSPLMATTISLFMQINSCAIEEVGLGMATTSVLGEYTKARLWLSSSLLSDYDPNVFVEGK